MINYAVLIAALIQVESGGVDDAIGDEGRAVGCLQIHEIFVEDVNRIAGTDYAPDSRYCRSASVVMATKWLKHYEQHYRETFCIEPSAETMARIYNSGFRGYVRNKRASDHYWSKVKKELMK